MYIYIYIYPPRGQKQFLISNPRRPLLTKGRSTFAFYMGRESPCAWKIVAGGRFAEKPPNCLILGFGGESERERDRRREKREERRENRE